jgi:hypothetical protein
VFVTSQGSAYSQSKHALERRNFMLAWAMAAELPKVPLADGLELLGDHASRLQTIRGGMLPRSGPLPPCYRAAAAVFARSGDGSLARCLRAAKRQILDHYLSST